MTRTGAIIGIALAAIAAIGGAQAATRKPAGVPLPAHSIVEARHAAMMMSASAFGALKAQAIAEDLKRAAFPAHALAGWAKAIPAMFPPGTNVAPTTALPALWSDRAGFEAAAQTFIAATASLHEAVEVNDKTAYAGALDRVGKACSACHDKYRKADQHH